MKKQFIILTAIFLITNTFLPRQAIAQTPEQMKYQAVARDNAGNVIANQLISFRISILQGSSSGTVVYSETHQATTNDFGLANLTIGDGTIESGVFSSIDWSADLYFLQVEMDETGGTTYQLMGTSQLLSVPYALHAKTAESAINGSHSLSDADGNTKIQVEKNPNEDIIRFDMGGTEQWIMTETRIEPKNSGGSVFIGEGAGANDDLSDNQNVAIGDSALFSNTYGAENTAIGHHSLYNSSGYINTALGVLTLFTNTSGHYNTAIGGGSLYSNESGESNTAIGFNSLGSNTTGAANSAHGSYALYYNKTGDYNTSTGYQALYHNTQSFNTATGSFALHNNTSGSSTTASGFQALYSNTTGIHNTANGSKALYSNISGHRNTATGTSALLSNETGNDNTAIGWAALSNNIDGYENTATGRGALYSNTSGYFNTANGKSALYYNTTGVQSTATGYQALVNNTTGHSNTAAGFQVLYDNTTGSQNTAVGTFALHNNVSGYNRTGIGISANSIGEAYDNNTGVGFGANCTASDQVILGNSSVGSIGGYANWTNVSDKKFSVNIEENVEGLSFIEKLRPVTYNMDLHAIDDFFAEHYNARDSISYDGKYDKEQIRYTGFIAQEVEEAARELGYDFSGVDKPKNEDDFYGLRYAEFVVPLVKGMQEQQELIEELSNENKQIKDELAHIKLLLNKIAQK